MQVKYNQQSFGMRFSPPAEKTSKNKNFTPKVLEYFDKLSKVEDEYFLDTLALNKTNMSTKFTIINCETGMCVTKTISKKRLCSFLKSLLDGAGLAKLFKSHK